MSSRSIEALVQYNAERCEAAKGPVCRCGCKGALHGKAHSAKWIRETVDRLQREAAERDPQADFLLADSTKFCGPCDSYVKPTSDGRCPRCGGALVVQYDLRRRWNIIPGEHVRLARKQTRPDRFYGRGCTQEEFAKLFGVNRRTIIRAERDCLNLWALHGSIHREKWVAVTGWDPSVKTCPAPDRCLYCRRSQK